MGDFSEGLSHLLLRELSILQMLKGHPSIVELYDFYFQTSAVEGKPPCFILCFEFASGGDLHHYIGEQLMIDSIKNDLNFVCTPIDYNFVRRILRQIFEGVNFMHSKGVIHRDLKAANILFDKIRCVVKIADFGLSRLVRQPMQPMTKEVQSMWYRAPEILLGNLNYTFAVDYWSLGIIAYELLYLKHRFQGTSEIDMLFKIFKEKGTPEFIDVTHPMYLSYRDDYTLANASFRVNFPRFKPTNKLP